MDRETATHNLSALLDVYRAQAQPISIGYLESGDMAGTPLITVGTTICRHMPKRYTVLGPVTVMSAQVGDMIREGKTSEEIVTAALDKFPAWTMAA